MEFKIEQLLVIAMILACVYMGSRAYKLYPVLENEEIAFEVTYRWNSVIEVDTMDMIEYNTLREKISVMGDKYNHLPVYDSIYYQIIGDVDLDGGFSKKLDFLINVIATICFIAMTIAIIKIIKLFPDDEGFE